MVAALRIDGGSLASLAAGIGKWVQQATVQIATEERARAGLDNDAVIVTDGVRGKAAQDVKPFGKIVFVAKPSMADAVLWALAKLIEISPVGPAEGGHYKDDHVVMINGKAVTGNLRVALSADRYRRPRPDRQPEDLCPEARGCHGKRPDTARPSQGQFSPGAERRLPRRSEAGRPALFEVALRRLQVREAEHRRESLGRRRRRSRQDQRQMGGA